MDSNNDPALDSSQGGVVPPVEVADEPASDDFGPSVEACIWSLAILAGGWLALRLYLKLRKHRGLWWDDHFLTLVSNNTRCEFFSPSLAVMADINSLGPLTWINFHGTV